MTQHLGYVILVLTVYTLAIARLTRLINADILMDPFRLWIATRSAHHQGVLKEIGDDPDKKQTYIHHQALVSRWNTALEFVECPWCVGMWLALGSVWVPMYFSCNPVARYLAIVLAVSHLVGVFAFAADTDDINYEDVETKQ